MFVVCALSLGAAGCASVDGLVGRYNHVSAISGAKPAAKTTIVFLIDGLSVDALRSAFATASAPHIARFFGVDEAGGFAVARASFPTLTYPNLAAIVTATPTSLNGIIGNRLSRRGNNVLNLEDASSWAELNDRLKGKTAFSRARAQGEASASFSYSVYAGSSAHQEKSLSAGIDYLSHSYDEIDRDTIASLASFLRDLRVVRPRLLFVHLIGVDGFAHRFGPQSAPAKAYISELDRALAPIFELIRPMAQVEVAMTADHGFVTTSVNRIEIAEIVADVDERLKTVADNRVASVFGPRRWSSERKRAAAQRIVRAPGIERVAVQFDDGLELWRADGSVQHIDYGPPTCAGGARSARLSWNPWPRQSGSFADFVCIEDFDTFGTIEGEAYLAASLLEFFASASAPDILVLAADDVDFVGGYKGNHGGLTPAEALVPILLRGRSPLGAGIPPTWQLLQGI